jgi:protein-L-isoaspartate(D-aspartate) O-methyltransferase
VPRHWFVPDACESEAYGDFPLPIGAGQTISQPLMVGVMTELLRLKGSERVLEIGTGSGYQTAVLTTLAREVITIERHASLSLEAGRRLDALGCKNVTRVIGDGTEGYPANAPYDAIIVTAGAPQIVPPPLVAQLAANGRLVIPLGGPRSQELTVLVKDLHGQVRRTFCGDCLFVPLIGKFGWDRVALED